MPAEKNAFDILTERGFIAQCTHEEELREIMGKEKITFYMGYDPTADSLTAGHLLTLMAHAHLQKAGHRLITLMGTGTGMIGDPTDRTEMRGVSTRETVSHNIACFKTQFARFVEYGDAPKAIMEENDWLLDLKLVDFMREYGIHFSVNKMLAAECYKSRLEGGLTAFEFTYMLMQAYDFVELYRRHGCTLQLGGTDQWGNIVAGVELLRKVEGARAYGLTFNLLTTGSGQKMGKTAKGAIWLSADKTSPYDFYQYWRNVEDSTVIRNLKLLTFLPLEEINEIARMEGSGLNAAKEVLAYEITKIVHGAEEAGKAQAAAKALFAGGGDLENMPTTDIPQAAISGGLNIIALLEAMKLIPSRAEGRRLIQQGGIKINDTKIESHEFTVTANDFRDGYLLVQKGKKIYHRGRLV
ncbi:MAG: tyrosine--tRNA ligase [Defluviitaleaceae bacterium]|nr:tyrosine--tRNA ligase [Defluviitaleaceae bacterium]